MKTKLTKAQRDCLKEMEMLERIYRQMTDQITDLFCNGYDRSGKAVIEAQIILRKGAEANYSYFFPDELPSWKGPKQ